MQYYHDSSRSYAFIGVTLYKQNYADNYGYNCKSSLSGIGSSYNDHIWDGSSTTWGNAQSHTLNEWFVIKCYYDGSLVHFVTDTESFTHSPSSSYTSGYVSIHSSSDYIKMKVDWFFVRKYTSPEPSVSVGEEQEVSSDNQQSVPSNDVSTDITISIYDEDTYTKLKKTKIILRTESNIYTFSNVKECENTTLNNIESTKNTYAICDNRLDTEAEYEAKDGYVAEVDIEGKAHISKVNGLGGICVRLGSYADEYHDLPDSLYIELRTYDPLSDTVTVYDTETYTTLENNGVYCAYANVTNIEGDQIGFLVIFSMDATSTSKTKGVIIKEIYVQHDAYKILDNYYLNTSLLNITNKKVVVDVSDVASVDNLTDNLYLPRTYIIDTNVKSHILYLLKKTSDYVDIIFNIVPQSTYEVYVKRYISNTLRIVSSSYSDVLSRVTFHLKRNTPHIIQIFENGVERITGEYYPLISREEVIYIKDKNNYLKKSKEESINKVIIKTEYSTELKYIKVTYNDTTQTTTHVEVHVYDNVSEVYSAESENSVVVFNIIDLPVNKTYKVISNELYI